MDTWTVIGVVGDVIITLLCLAITAAFAACWLCAAGYFANRHTRNIQRSTEDFIVGYYDGLQESLMTHLERERDNARE